VDSDSPARRHYRYQRIGAGTPRCAGVRNNATHRGTNSATRRSRTGDLLITKPDQGETPPHQEELSLQKTEDPG
jgi:hypothetical protein